ncbi:hypothetical protein [Stackebrandtia albiflava]|nr:hypothetical protein [Stackebrandtia albiflava]
MTDPTPQQQPGYPTAEQQAAYAQQQQAAYAAQQQQAAAYQQAQPPAQPASQMFDKLPMNMLTFGLAAGGVAAMLIGLLVAGAKDADLIGGGMLSLWAAVVVLTAIVITTGPKFRGTLRVIVLALVVLELGSTIGGLLGSGGNADGAVIIGELLFVAGLGLLAAATLTMSERPAVAAGHQHTGVIQQVPQQVNPQQYPGQQPQQGGWQ